MLKFQRFCMKMLQKMKDIFESDMDQCERLLLSKWKKRPLLQKALESVVRLISPIL